SQATLGVASISPQAGSQVNGVAILKFNPHEGKIDVTVDVAGLPPNSMHPAHIHSGISCGANGPILFPFQPLKADAAGVAHETVTIPAQAVPVTGWYVNVHMGPDLVGAHGTPIGCGVVTRGL
ncbi:MAG TPA: CHRD domain-containing protein, partial [Chloroflexota bacterium]|nr:CHRD domain-containing protein [Chloroflexota bacterium]